MDTNFKVKTLSFLIIIIILFIIIASGLSKLKLEAGMPIPKIDIGNNTVKLETKSITKSIEINDFLIIILSLSLIILIFIFLIRILIKIYSVIKKKQNVFNNLKNIIIFFILISIGITSLIYIMLHFSVYPTLESFIPAPKEALRVPLGTVPATVIWLSGFILVSLIILFIFKILLSKKQPNLILNLLELEALKAKKSIENGKDFKDVIIKCYYQMCQILKKEQDIEREVSMTVNEFEKRLEEAGAPKNSIKTLTELFELVRYGNQELGNNAEKKAIDCFQAIIQHFRKLSMITSK